jgi:hypothetical protein
MKRQLPIYHVDQTDDAALIGINFHTHQLPQDHDPGPHRVRLHAQDVFPVFPDLVTFIVGFVAAVRNIIDGHNIASPRSS